MKLGIDYIFPDIWNECNVSGSLNKHLLNACCVSHTVLGPEDDTVLSYL